MEAYENPLLFSIPDYEHLARTITTELSLETGCLETHLFPDGERYLRLESDVRGRHVICLGGTTNHRTTLDLYDLASAIVDQGARRLTIAIPYFGYSTMERATMRGEAVVAKYRARLLSSIPHATERSTLLFFDLHSPGIPHYLEHGLASIHLRSFHLLGSEIKRLGGEDFVLGSTDAGRAKWVETMANAIGVEAAFILKRRLKEGRTEVLALNARVEGRTVVIYDDMIRSGGSLISAAKAYHDAGARKLIGVATHGLFTPGALDRIAASQLFDSIVCTDSHPQVHTLDHDILNIVSCSSVFVEQLRKTL